jgi:hypothetical protein
MKNIFSTIVLLAICAQGMMANNGSQYSRFGIGDLSLTSSVRSLSLGSTGTALASEGYIDQNNPASLGTITRTLINGSYQYRGYRASDGTASSYLNAGGFLGASMAFPVYKPYGIVLAVGLAPVSNASYYFDITDTYGSQSISQTFNGRGGLTALQMSVTYSPKTDLSLGATMDYMFGTIREDHKLTYINTTYYASDIVSNASLHGFAFHFGAMQAGLDKALGLSSTKHVTLGVSLYTGGSLTSSQNQLRHLSTADTTVLASDNTITLPLGVSAGLAYQNNGVVYTGDVNLEQWSDLKMYGSHPSEIQNSMRAGFGIEWMPGKDFIESYWQQVAWRLGGYAHQTYVKVNGTSINEYFATAGIGLPLGNEARLNIGLEYGVRGTTSLSLVKNNILRLTLSINAGDIWFIQPEVE